MRVRTVALTRRGLIKTSAAAVAFQIVPRHVIGGVGQTPPSERLTLAGIGVGGVGCPHLDHCAQVGFQIAALCDVDDLHARKSYDRYPQARRYRDFRELLAAEGDRIDAVYCGTPDHTHAVIALAALRARKHVCCVKPLTRTVEECRAVIAAAESAGVATQVTAMSNTDESGRRTAELIGAGAIGPVREVHVWSHRPGWPQGMPGRPDGEDPIPDTLDWNLWIGPAPMRPFKSEWPVGNPLPAMSPNNWAGRKVYHPFNFRGWWDFGTGALGDMGCHYFNTPFLALKLGYPRRVAATSSRRHDESFPLASMVTFDFPARGDFPEVRVVWYDGGLQPPRPRNMTGRWPDEGALYIGDKGQMIFDRILDPALAEAGTAIPRTLTRRSGIWGEWMEACRGGERAGCDFVWSGPPTETVLLGNIALRTGREIEYDPVAMRIPNSTEADGLLRQPLRNGWSLAV